jgi:hypothetical protein
MEKRFFHIVFAETEMIEKKTIYKKINLVNILKKKSLVSKNVVIKKFKKMYTPILINR